MGRQIAFVFDLNKCIGCQTCSVACKVLWHHEEQGVENQWWCSVNTMPVINPVRVASGSVCTPTT